MSLTRAEINKNARERLKVLYNEYETFRAFIDDGGTKKQWLDFFDVIYEEPNIEVSYGFSRGVLIFNEFDWVIKFNFSDEDADYSELEVKFYNEAVASQLQEFFAKIWFGGAFHGVLFYVMEKAYINESEIDLDLYSGVYDSDKRYYDKASKLLYEDDECGIINFFGCYASVERVLQLVEFCGNMGIEDVHSGNLGYINGDPVFIDYAGVRGY